MAKSLSFDRPLNWLFAIAYLLFFVSLCFYFRGYLSIAIPLIALYGFLHLKLSRGKLFSADLRNPILISCSIYFILQVLHLLTGEPDSSTPRRLLLKSSIIFIPLALCCGDYLTRTVFAKLMNWFILILAGASAFCLCVAFYKYANGASGEVLFYHSLVSPLKHHAVQFSLLVYFGMLYMMDSLSTKAADKNGWLQIAAVSFFFFMILLLSSKLVIVFSVITLFYYIYLSIVKKRLTLRSQIAVFITLLLLAILTISTPNPISKRFAEVLHPNFALLKQQKYDPNTYFNGVEFRLLQVRFVKEILDAEDAWLTGVSSSAQGLLIKKYSNLNMYMGDGKDDPGYARYNTHNQFLEALLQAGIPGLLSFVSICLAMLFLAKRSRNRTVFLVVLILLFYSLNESVLEKQYGISIFTFFPLFFYFGSRSKAVPDPS